MLAGGDFIYDFFLAFHNAIHLNLSYCSAKSPIQPGINTAAVRRGAQGSPEPALRIDNLHLSASITGNSTGDGAQMPKAKTI